MRFLLASIAKDLLRHAREPLLFLVWLGIPLLVGVLMNLALAIGGGRAPRVTLLVASEETSWIDRALDEPGELLRGTDRVPESAIEALGRVFELERVTPAEGRERMERGEASALLVLPAGLGRAVLTGEPATLELVTNPAQQVLPGIAEEAVRAVRSLVFYARELRGEAFAELADGSSADAQGEAVARELARAAERADGVLFPPLLDVAAGARPDGPGAGPPGTGSLLELLFPGFLMMALCFMAEAFSSDIWQERQRGTLARALATPGGAAPLVLGKVGAGASLMVFVSVATAALGGMAFDLDTRALVLLALFSPLAGAAFQLAFLALHVHAPTQRAGNVLGSLILFPLLMAGGSFFPFEAMPGWLAAVGRVTPNGWVLAHLKAVAFSGAPIGTLAVPALAVLSVGALFGLLVLRRLPRFVLP